MDYNEYIFLDRNSELKTFFFYVFITYKYYSPLHYYFLMYYYLFFVF